MQIWSNTSTLDGYLPGLSFSQDKATADVALIGGKAIDLAEFPRLRGIFKTGVGRDNVPEAAAAARGIDCEFPSADTRGIIYEETANFTCHLVFKCLYAEAGDFATWKKIDRPALASREVFVVGTGNIGGRVAARLRPFVRVTTFDTLANDGSELEALVRGADVVSLHIPLDASTRDLFDARKLRWLRDGAALVNTARAAIVSESALLQELQSGRIRAAFDVFWQEPYKGPLTSLSLDRFMVSPHVASTCREFLTATARDFLTFLDALERKAKSP